ncbi:MAG: carbon-nitrogen hydrolase family protein [Ferrovibrionaceae bacterium]
MSRPARLKAAQYPITRERDFAGWKSKLDAWVAEGVRDGADLLLFPEYGAMELAALITPAMQGDLHREIAGMQALLPGFIETHAGLARRHRVHIAAASFPVRDPDGRYRNRVHVFGPDGTMAVQDKIVMTRFEREDWDIAGGSRLQVIETGFARIGLAICYDVEFPLIARALVEAGAEIILAPSCTDTLAGSNRVWVGARSRALENQCVVAVSPTVGAAPWSLAVDVNRGRAGVFSAPDRGLPDDGILAAGPVDQPGWVSATVDLDAVDRVRREGQVLNHRDWPEQVVAGEVALVRV